MAISNRGEMGVGGGSRGGSGGGGSKTPKMTQAQRNKIIAQEAKKIAKREAKVVEIQGKKMTIGEAEKAAAALRAKMEVTPLMRKNSKVLEQIKAYKEAGIGLTPRQRRNAK